MSRRAQLSMFSPAMSARAYAGSATESDIQKAILDLLKRHPAVAWAYRMNVGAGTFTQSYVGETKLREPRFVRFAFKGCSDILGQMRDGRFLAIEVKRPGKGPTEEQAAFIDRVSINRGVSGVARSVEDAMEILKG